MLKVVLVDEYAVIPSRGSKYAAGLDLTSCQNCIVPSKGKLLISTGISVAIPLGTYGRVAPRSGIACKNFIDVGAGVIDSDYRGIVKVLLFNHSDDEFVVNIGDRIAQLIIEKYLPVEVETVTTLEDSERMDNGFGSTGK